MGAALKRTKFLGDLCLRIYYMAVLFKHPPSAHKYFLPPHGILLCGFYMSIHQAENRRRRKTMKYKSKEKSDYTPIPEGPHHVVCSAFVDVGMQEAFGAVKPQFLLRLEFPGSRFDRAVNGVQVNEPMVKWQFYTNSLNKKANLRRDLEGILARGLTKDELADGYNTPDLVGKAWQVSIIHDNSGDSVKDKMSSMNKLMEGTAIPAPELPAILYSRGLKVEEHWDLLPEWVQNKVNEQIENLAANQPPVNEDPFIDDACPF
jgi:hypothetical protein